MKEYIIPAIVLAGLIVCILLSSPSALGILEKYQKTVNDSLEKLRESRRKHALEAQKRRLKQELEQNSS